MIRVVSPGLYSSVQDEGRRGLRRLGIPWAGALVPAFLHGANGLVGNRPDAPAIECFEGGLELELETPARLALAALGTGARLEAIGPDGAVRALAPWCGHRLEAGVRVRLRASGDGRTATLGIAGLEVAPVHGSASTYPGSGLGGLDGRALAAGDALPCAPAPAPGPERRLTDAAVVRLSAALLDARTSATGGGGGGQDPPFAILSAVPGPQAGAFRADALETLFDARGWRVSAATDRMGARLEGAPLAHADAGARDIVSDAIVPGSIQVPGTGLPIVLLADAHTAGGYPKIATLASADLAAVALARPGARIRLLPTDVAGAVARTRALRAEVERALADTVPALPELDARHLLAVNLVDGVTDGRDADPPPTGDPACD